MTLCKPRPLNCGRFIEAVEAGWPPPASSELLRFFLWSLHGHPAFDHTARLLAYSRHVDALPQEHGPCLSSYGRHDKDYCSFSNRDLGEENQSYLQEHATSMNCLLSTGDNRPVHASSDRVFGSTPSHQASSALLTRMGPTPAGIRPPRS